MATDDARRPMFVGRFTFHYPLSVVPDSRAGEELGVLCGVDEPAPSFLAQDFASLEPGGASCFSAPMRVSIVHDDLLHRARRAERVGAEGGREGQPAQEEASRASSTAGGEESSRAIIVVDDDEGEDVDDPGLDVGPRGFVHFRNGWYPSNEVLNPRQRSASSAPPLPLEVPPGHLAVVSSYEAAE